MHNQCENPNLCKIRKVDISEENGKYCNHIHNKIKSTLKTVKNINMQKIILVLINNYFQSKKYPILPN